MRWQGVASPGLGTIQERAITTTAQLSDEHRLPSGGPNPSRPYRIVLVEDDRGDAVLVEALLDEHISGSVLTWHPGLEADELVDGDTDCVLVDLGLPGYSGLSALEAVLARVPDLPVIVLTGLDDRAVGLAALAAGASDYLVKGFHDGEALARAIGYAVERNQAAMARSRLREAELLRAENLRLERGLLPRPLLSTSDVTWALRYRPGAGTSVLGGDFLDMVERPDGSIRLVVGDVSGHGPDEAALGVCMRIAWRTLILRGIDDDDMMPALDDVLSAERQQHQFCTVCDVTISADRRRVTWRLAGHPPPILLGERPSYLPNARRGVPVGIQADLGWYSDTVDLPGPWGLLVFTDGVFESELGDGTRLELTGLLDLVGTRPFPALAADLDALLEVVQQPHADAGHPDDLAILGLLVPGPQG